MMIKLCYLLGLVTLVAAGDVLDWVDSDFEENAAAEDLVLVKFYAPW
jgi:hypothetical protein